MVVTDYESMRSGSNKPEEAIDRDAGGARRVLERIVGHRGTSGLDPMLVTGPAVLAADGFGPTLAGHFNVRGSKRKVCAWSVGAKRPGPLASGR